MSAPPNARQAVSRDFIISPSTLVSASPANRGPRVNQSASSGEAGRPRKNQSGAVEPPEHRWAKDSLLSYGHVK